MRVFLAVPLAETFSCELESFLSAHQTLPHMKWNPAWLVHVTLHFFGKVSEAQVETISLCASGAAGETEPFPLTMKGTGYFPDTKNPRVLWAGIQDPENGLKKLHADLEKRLSAAGFSCETRPYHPHATLGRPQPGFKFSPLEFPRTPSQTMARMHLYQSILSPQGSEYKILQTFPFFARFQKPSR